MRWTGAHASVVVWCRDFRCSRVQSTRPVISSFLDNSCALIASPGLYRCSSVPLSLSHTLAVSPGLFLSSFASFASSSSSCIPLKQSPRPLPPCPFSSLSSLSSVPLLSGMPASDTGRIPRIGTLLPSQASSNVPSCSRFDAKKYILTLTLQTRSPPRIETRSGSRSCRWNAAPSLSEYLTSTWHSHSPENEPTKDAIKKQTAGIRDGDRFDANRRFHAWRGGGHPRRGVSAPCAWTSRMVSEDYTTPSHPKQLGGKPNAPWKAGLHLNKRRGRSRRALTHQGGGGRDIVASATL